jgi:AmiR/NasT family two-component response regulator
MATEYDLTGVLDDHRMINIAIGVLMGRLTITDVDAYDLLLEASISSYRSLADVSRSYVDSPN